MKRVVPAAIVLLLMLGSPPPRGEAEKQETARQTARYFMSVPADALLQVATRPSLAGSQRILHVLRQYEQASPGKGPGLKWFVDVALGRSRHEAKDTKPDNPYLNKVDAEIEDADVRAAIRRVQPACVRLSGGGSGVNLTASGHVLTCAHVANKVGAKMTALFPDGRKYKGTCTAIDKKLDLAIVRLAGARELPFAPLARTPPVKGTDVVCIGQPGSVTPKGKATGYKPFHVSTGVIRGFLANPLGNQSLGRTKHDAWTYWGHSGSPLFNQAGQIVALHNSWDSTTAMRHAVTQQAIAHFLKKTKVDYATAK